MPAGSVPAWRLKTRARLTSWSAPVALLATAAASRFILLPLAAGEADCSRFLIGITQWVRFGPGAHIAYGAIFSPAYYALATFFTRLYHWDLSALAAHLQQWSAWSSLWATFALYWLGTRITTRPVAYAAALLTVFSPAFWWLSVEAHPQMLSYAALLLALAAWAEFWRATARRSRPQLQYAWAALSAAALTAALLLKSDAVLYCGAFAGVALLLDKPAPVPVHRWRLWLRPLVVSAALWGLSAVLFLTLRQRLLSASLSATQHKAGATVASFLQWPRGLALLKQLAPVAFAAGVGFWLLLAVALAWFVFAHKTASQRQRSLCLAVLACFWSAPPLTFWFLIRGNNVRHVALCFVPILWWALEQLSLRALFHRRDASQTFSESARDGSRSTTEGLRVQNSRPQHTIPALAPATALAMAVTFWAVPASSNVTLFPSGNLLSSAQLLNRKAVAMRHLSQVLQDHAGRSSGRLCYLGFYSNPYIIEDLLRRQPSITLSVSSDWIVASFPNQGRIWFGELPAPEAFSAYARRCNRVWSAEFNGNGRHRLFLGSEWKWARAFATSQ